MRITALAPALGILATLTALLAGTYAFFSDTEASVGNSAQADTMDLSISDRDEGFLQGNTATWVMANMVPGQSTVAESTILRNDGSVTADHVEIAFTHEIDDGDPSLESDTNPNSNPEDLARWMRVDFLKYDGRLYNLSPVGGSFSDSNGNGFIDLDDLADPVNEGALDNLRPPRPNFGNPNLGSTESLDMALSFHPNATNDIQGDTLITSVHFTLNQDPSQ